MDAPFILGLSEAGIARLLGLLAGDVPGSQENPERIFTIRFDPKAGEWVGLGGGLVSWMKSEFLRAG